MYSPYSHVSLSVLYSCVWNMQYVPSLLLPGLSMQQSTWPFVHYTLTNTQKLRHISWAVLLLSLLQLMLYESCCATVRRWGHSTNSTLSGPNPAGFQPPLHFHSLFPLNPQDLPVIKVWYDHICLCVQLICKEYWSQGAIRKCQNHHVNYTQQ